jgi:hypothetical protein
MSFSGVSGYSPINSFVGAWYKCQNCFSLQYVETSDGLYDLMGNHCCDNPNRFRQDDPQTHTLKAPMAFFDSRKDEIIE